MMAQKRFSDQQAFELPRRTRERGTPAPVYRERMQRRREEVAREAERARRLDAAKLRRGRALCLLLATGLAVLCGMRIYQSSAAARNAARISSLEDELHELSMYTESYECRIAQAASDENITAGAARLGMGYPTEGQLRTVNPD